MSAVSRDRVLAFRLQASHLDHKLTARADRPSVFEQASAGGLQDSAPRAAVISLHARVEDVRPHSWEHESLVQIWGPRGADYVVPRSDVGVFTLGRLPRDDAQRNALERIADDIHRVTNGRMTPTRDVSAALPELGHLIRASSITGRVNIRWDASKIWLIPATRPEVDVEEARLELARRFLRWFAPATRERFAWWSGVDDVDARETWSALSGELVEVEVAGETRHVLTADEPKLRRATPVRGVRLLPHGDPFLKIDGALVVPDATRRPEVFPISNVKTKFWPVSGALLSDGEVVGSWARQQRKVTIHPWMKLDSRVRDAAEQEALSFPIASSTKAKVSWVF